MLFSASVCCLATKEPAVYCVPSINRKVGVVAQRKNFFKKWKVAKKSLVLWPRVASARHKRMDICGYIAPRARISSMHHE